MDQSSYPGAPDPSHLEVYEPASPAPIKPNSTGRRNRARILREAARSFACKGFAATTIGDVARSSGLPKANINYYFSSKQNLYQQVLEMVAVPYLQAFALLQPDSEPGPALGGMIRANLRLIRKQPWAAKVLAAELLHGARQLPGSHIEHLQGEVERSLDCLRQWIARGQLAALDPQHLLISLWATTLAYANFGSQLMAGGVGKINESELEAGAQTLTQLLLRGVINA
ncbi:MULTISPECIES: TetR/AcrR family transcriptional regulator [unclassified Pseudomonas]|uniref:TetR/AcrR family transcriptional regulator n=1 Tax=unclassified Pseudomonas TaxID=196821 RepID=UPI00088DF0B0|nr:MULTISPECIES: TetR/AcrR family transcriptional regulator [unclassified Pseudomonas]QVM98629.1 TetR family transcriptional regulator C-terminal domain-containing protein [Pseudomonas sp. SORT22]UVL54496.1 TetR/AcrR family transcriptional regulator [Pseudomonas sp. B21-035]SDQ59009.1 transcriptional regulator, TetR family [Pseudomonas sp. UC 17F4]